MAGLLNLPVETRLRIYQNYFAQRDYETQAEYVKVDVHTSRFLVKQHTWPLFEVCKQIYLEVMPEYYSSTEFHFSALIHLRETISRHAVFQKYARHIVLNPHFTFPSVDDLLLLPNLQTLTISNMTCREPIRSASGTALQHSTLKSILDEQGNERSNHYSSRKAIQLCEAMKEVPELNVHLLLRFRYTYVEKAKHPSAWYGTTAKRHRVINYDCTDDVFTLLKPDEDEAAIIPHSTP